MTTPAAASSRVVAAASWLLDAACDELATTASGPVGVRLFAPGSTPPPADWCCDTGTGTGMAWVRIARRYRSRMFPAPESTPGCTGASLAVELEVGVYRCVATLDNAGEPPSPVDVTADALAADADACALAEAVGRLRWTNVRGAWTPVGPSGGCGGGIQTVIVAVEHGPIGK